MASPHAHTHAPAAARVPTTGNNDNPFYYGHSPGAATAPRGKQMNPRDVDTTRLGGPTRDELVADEAVKLEHDRSAFDRGMGDSDAAHRGKRMYGDGAHRNNANLFEKYGSHPPPKARPFGATRDTSPEKLLPYVHKGHDDAREREVEKIATSPSAFDRNFEGQQLHGFFREKTNPDVTPLAARRAQRGLLDAVTEKSGDATPGRTSKRMLHHEEGVLSHEDKPIPGFRGVGVGQESHIDRIRARETKEMMPPMQPHFGTEADARYGTHGFTTVPPAPPKDHRSGWFNWTEDRQRCPVNDASFDPLALKVEHNSPGDPLNHPQRKARIDLGTPQTHFLLRNDPQAQDQVKPQCVKMYPTSRTPVGAADDVVVGFGGMGNPDRERVNDRPRGTRKLSPHHEQPHRPRARSSLDTYQVASDYYFR